MGELSVTVPTRATSWSAASTGRSASASASFTSAVQILRPVSAVISPLGASGMVSTSIRCRSVVPSGRVTVTQSPASSAGLGTVLKLIVRVAPRWSASCAPRPCRPAPGVRICGERVEAGDAAIRAEQVRRAHRVKVAGERVPRMRRRRREVVESDLRRALFVLPLHARGGVGCRAAAMSVWLVSQSHPLGSLLGHAFAFRLLLLRRSLRCVVSPTLAVPMFFGVPRLDSLPLSTFCGSARRCPVDWSHVRLRRITLVQPRSRGGRGLLGGHHR